MRVRLLADLRLYWNYAIAEFKKGEEHVAEFARHLADNAPAGTVEVLEDDRDGPAAASAELKQDPAGTVPPEDDVPEDDQSEDAPPVDGTIDDLMTWVGEDKDRAVQALDAEKAKDKPRSTVIKRLMVLTGEDE